MKLENCSFFKFCRNPKRILVTIHKIPHFKALEEYFGLLAWVLTLGAIIFAFLSRMSVYFFYSHFTYLVRVPFSSSIAVSNWREMSKRTGNFAKAADNNNTKVILGGLRWAEAVQPLKNRNHFLYWYMAIKYVAKQSTFQDF